jgi:putative ABC transport system ATP-binding protein
MTGGKCLMEIIKTIELSKSYGKKDMKVEALKNVNISINQGEFVAIVGPSGSGKSTLMHMIGGIDSPTSGKVFVDNNDIYLLNNDKLAIFRRRKIGFVFQSYNLVPVLTAEENIILPILLDNKKPEDNYIKDILNILGLTQRRNHLPSELSGGQQQRVSIGRAMVCKPSIILADEPTGNLDTKNGKEIIELLKVSAKKYNQTLVIVTHDINIASQAGRIIGIEDGSLVEV